MGAGHCSLLIVLVGGAAAAPAPRLDSDFLAEDFEAVIVPPPGWTLDTNASDPNTWHATSAWPYVRRGSGAALIRWQSARVQDESLITVPIDLGAVTGDGMYLSFWWYTDPFWFGGANTVFRVYGSLEGAAWDLLWNVDDVTEVGWAWRQALVDVSAYAGRPGEFRVRFRYKGRDAADLALDDVRLGYVVPPGSPANDDCAGALAADYVIGPAAGPFTVTGNNTFARSHYPLDVATSCTGSNHAGNDVVWVVDLPGDHVLHATMTTKGGWDDTLFLIADCGNPAGTCVAGDRSIPDGSTLSFRNGSAATERYYLVASAFGAGRGEFTVSGSITKETAIQAESWTAVKARYR